VPVPVEQETVCDAMSHVEAVVKSRYSCSRFHPFWSKILHMLVEMSN
jgi:hypothetical protein